MNILLWLLQLLGKPALIVVLQFLEKQYPGIKPLLDKIIQYLEGAQNKPQAAEALCAHFDSFCPADVKGDK